MYTGKEGGSVSKGLGAQVVEDLTRHSTGLCHHVYLDNFFYHNITDAVAARQKNIQFCTNRKGFPISLKKPPPKIGNTILF